MALSADVQTPHLAQADRDELTDAPFDPRSGEAGLTCTPPSKLFQIGKSVIPCYNSSSYGSRVRRKCRGFAAAIRPSAGVAAQRHGLSCFWTRSISKAIFNRSEGLFPRVCKRLAKG